MFNKFGMFRNTWKIVQNELGSMNKACEEKHPEMDPLHGGLIQL
jgi:hypothetical protein